MCFPNERYAETFIPLIQNILYLKKETIIHHNRFYGLEFADSFWLHSVFDYTIFVSSSISISNGTVLTDLFTYSALSLLWNTGTLLLKLTIFNSYWLCVLSLCLWVYSQLLCKGVSYLLHALYQDFFSQSVHHFCTGVLALSLDLHTFICSSGL